MIEQLLILRRAVVFKTFRTANPHGAKKSLTGLRRETPKTINSRIVFLI